MIRTTTRTTICRSLCAFALALGLAGAGAAGGGEPVYKDLQVLPKDTDKPTLKALMKKQAKALGVECDHCHDEPRMDADTKNKTISRDMMRLTDALNAGKVPTATKAQRDLGKAINYYKKHLAGKKDITCMTCHNGKEEPA